MRLPFLQRPVQTRASSSGLRRVVRATLALAALVLPVVAGIPVLESASASEKKLTERHYTMAPAAPKAQTWAEARAKSDGCMTCHTETDQHTMHANPGVVLGCTDCHGGDNSIRRAEKGPEADR